MSRKQFLKWSLAGGAAVVAGSTVPGLTSVNRVKAQTPSGEVPQYPFPQAELHAVYTAGTIKPDRPQAALDEETQKFYLAWKARYLKEGEERGCSPGTYYVYVLADGNGGGGMDRNSISISEGHGYGMMITALMAGYDPDAKTYFDGLYKFFKEHLTHQPLPPAPPLPLMGWNQVKGCVNADTKNNDGSGTATDGDLDIAYALLLADRQWGSDGDIDYLQEATDVINAIMDKEINPDTSLPFLANGEEDWLQDDLYKYGTRPSDFIVDHIRAYQSATGDDRWTDVIDAVYTLMEAMQTRYSPRTGLLPDFVQDTNTDTPRPVSAGYLEGRWDGHYSWNACRVPWRIGTDYLTSGDTRASDVLDKINTWIRTKTGDDPRQIYSGYKRNGKRFGREPRPMAFVAPFGVGAMVNADNQEWLDAIWDLTVKRTRIYEDYYGNTLKVLAMITMSGNWWKP